MEWTIEPGKELLEVGGGALLENRCHSYILNFLSFCCRQEHDHEWWTPSQRTMLGGVIGRPWADSHPNDPSRFGLVRDGRRHES